MLNGDWFLTLFFCNTSFILVSLLTGMAFKNWIRLKTQLGGVGNLRNSQIKCGIAKGAYSPLLRKVCMQVLWIFSCCFVTAWLYFLTITAWPTNVIWCILRLIKDFDRAVKEEEGRNSAETIRMLSDKKQSMVLFCSSTSLAFD